MKKEYTNGDITVVWEPLKCIHSGICVKGLPDVFQPKEKPWIKIEGASSTKIEEQVKACPSGALSYYYEKQKINTENMSEVQKSGTMIQVIPNGPVKVSGPCEVALPNGETTTSEKDVFLCRCGASSNKPYCDGTHKKIEFEAS